MSRLLLNKSWRLVAALLFLLLCGWGVSRFIDSRSALSTEKQTSKNISPTKHSAHIRGGEPRLVSVVAATARLGVVNHVQSALGTVTPLAMATVHTRMDGELLRVHFQEGQQVKKGQLLAEIDPRPLQAALKQAQGQLLRDQALLRTAQHDLQRYKTLLEQDSIAKQQYDTQVELVKQYQGMVLTDQGNVDNAKVQLSFALVKAPLSGRIGLRTVDPGNIVRVSDANGLFAITQTQPVSVLFTVPETALDAIRHEQSKSLDVAGNKKNTSGTKKILAQAWDREGKKQLAQGLLHSFDNQIDPATGTIKMRALFDNKNEGLFPNQFVNIKLILDVRNDALLVPIAAVLRGKLGTYVYVIRADNSVTVRPVTLGTEMGDEVEVLSGLQAGEKVAVEGSDNLREGSRVTLRESKGPQK